MTRQRWTSDGSNRSVSRSLWVARHMTPGLALSSRVLLLVGYALHQIHNLTPSGVERISGLARGITPCEGGWIRSVQALDSACGFVIENLCSFFANRDSDLAAPASGRLAALAAIRMSSRTPLTANRRSTARRHADQQRCSLLSSW